MNSPTIEALLRQAASVLRAELSDEDRNKLDKLAQQIRSERVKNNGRSAKKKG